MIPAMSSKRGRTAEDKIEAIIRAGNLPPEELDAFLRSQGLSRDQVEAWHLQALDGLRAAEPQAGVPLAGEPDPRGEITRLLDAWSDGDPQALDELMPLVFAELRQIAGRRFDDEPSSHTLQPTALVNELYVKLKAQRKVSFHDREKFFAVAAKWIRRILVDHARKRLTARRGGDVVKIRLIDQMGLPEEKAPDVLLLDDALKDLAAVHPRQSRILELRIFGGFTVDEIAESEEIARSTVKRDWNVATLWLRKELKTR